MLEKLPRIQEQLNLDEGMMKILPYTFAPKKNQANALYKLSLMIQLETLDELRKLNNCKCYQKDCCSEAHQGREDRRNHRRY